MHGPPRFDSAPDSNSEWLATAKQEAILIDPNELISVYQAENSTEAHLVKNLLLDEGIDATVSEANEVITLSIVPAHVLVRRADEDRARAVVAEYDAEQERRADRPDWKCPACGVDVIGAFDECDACGADRPGTEEED
jgi:putative signal transducing protein